MRRLGMQPGARVGYTARYVKRLGRDELAAARGSVLSVTGDRAVVSWDYRPAAVVELAILRRVRP